jgi:hypothetical protein
VAPAFGLIRSLLSRGPASRDDLEHAGIEAAVDVCSEDELDRSGRLVVRLSDPPIDVLVIRTRRQVFAVENRCPHLGVLLATPARRVPLGRRPYYLRHAAVWLWLTPGGRRRGLYCFNTRRRVAELRFVAAGRVGHARDSCLSVCCTC